MKCSQCGGTCREKHDSYSWDEPYLGKVTIVGHLYYQCDQCQNVLLSNEMAGAMDDLADRRKQALISGYPLADFMSAAETARYLGISRQALHKNRRIRHGFIFQATLDGSHYYLRQSVERYKQTQDGRFPLCELTVAGKLACEPELVCEIGDYYRSRPVSKSKKVAGKKSVN